MAEASTKYHQNVQGSLVFCSGDDGGSAEWRKVISVDWEVIAY